MRGQWNGGKPFGPDWTLQESVKDFQLGFWQEEEETQTLFGDNAAHVVVAQHAIWFRRIQSDHVNGLLLSCRVRFTQKHLHHSRLRT